MVDVVQVPTNGFSGVPNPGPSPVPQGASQSQGLPPGVPPAGPPPQMPNRSADPVALPGQQPGFVQPKPVTPLPQQQEQTQVQPDLTNIVALLEQALGKPEAVAPANETSDKPTWLQGSLNEFDVNTLDDPILKSMATVMQVVGKDLDLSRVLGNALANGDDKLIDYAYLAEKGGANAQQLAEIAKGIVQAVNAKSDSITAAVHATAGGEAGWNTAVAAFNKNAPVAIRTTVAAMLDSTDSAKIQAAAQIVAQYGSVSGLIPQKGAPLLQGASGSQAAAQGLSKVQFQAEHRKLNTNSPTYETERQELFSRRSLGRSLGL